MKQPLLIFKIFSIALICTVFTSCTSTYHSSENSEGCKVLLPSISDDYEGYCKKGLAHGQGIATGLHTYEGEFENGYPAGEGTYTWHDERKYTGSFVDGERNGFGTMYYTENGEEKIGRGFWINGDLAVRTDKNDPYKILTQRGVVKASLRKEAQSIANKIRISVTRNGESVKGLIGDFNINTSSGTVPPPADYLDYYEITSITYPVLISITYTIPNLMATATINNQVDIEILEPGFWAISLDNK